MREKTWSFPLPPADRPFLDTVKTRVSSAVLFSAVSDVSAHAPHPTGQAWEEPLLDDRPGAGQLDQELSSQIDQNWNTIWNQVTETVGISVPHAVDLPHLLDSRRDLVQAVIAGRPDLVEGALSRGADPHTLVPVKHPNQMADQTETFVALPVGVAAAMLLQRYERTAKAQGVLDKTDVRVQRASYERIARRLLLDGNNMPTIKVGTAADGVGVAVSFYSWGVEGFTKWTMPKSHTRALGGMSLVRHNEPINLALANVLGRLSPDLVSDQRLLPQNMSDDLLGYALPAEMALDSVAHTRRLELGQNPLGNAAIGSDVNQLPEHAVSRSARVAQDYVAPNALIPGDTTTTGPSGKPKH